MSRSYSNQRDKNLSKITRIGANNRRFEDTNSQSSTVLANQGAITQLSEQMYSLNDRMDEFTTCIEELNSKLISKKNSPSQQNLLAETCNGSAPTSYFTSSLNNGSLSKLTSSSSSSQLAKESPLLEEISTIARGQRQMMHQLDNLSILIGENMGDLSQTWQMRNGRKYMAPDAESIKLPLVPTNSSLHPYYPSCRESENTLMFVRLPEVLESFVSIEKQLD